MTGKHSRMLLQFAMRYSGTQVTGGCGVMGELLKQFKWRVFPSSLRGNIIDSCSQGY